MNLFRWICTRQRRGSAWSCVGCRLRRSWTWQQEPCPSTTTKTRWRLTISPPFSTRRPEVSVIVAKTTTSVSGGIETSQWRNIVFGRSYSLICVRHVLSSRVILQNMSHVMCAMCVMSHVMCVMSYVSCHMTCHVICIMYVYIIREQLTDCK